MSARRVRLIEAALLALLFTVGASAGLRPVPAYTPRAGDSFNYSETIRVSNGQGSLELSPYVTYGLVLVAILVVVAVVAYVAARRRHSRRPLPEHPRYESPPPPAAPGESKIDLGSRPPEQVVLKEVAMVNCKFCGALIPTTAATCPRCGAPMQ